MKSNKPNIKKVSVIIPAYNEAGVIAKIVKGALSYTAVNEVLVIDDCSDDKTAKNAQAAGAHVIRHPYNKGNGSAVKTGLRNAKNEYVILMDGDGQHDPKFIPDFINSMKTFDMVIGTRDAESEANIVRRVGNFILKNFASYLGGYKIKDLTSGYRAGKRSLFLEFIHLYPNRYSYPTTSTLAFLKAGYNVGYMKIKNKPRVGKSKLKPFRNGIKFLIIIMRISTIFSPLKFFGPVSLIPLLGGIGYGIYNIIKYTKLPNTAVLLISVGVIIFMMGLLSEQIAALHFARHKNENDESL